MGGAGAAQDDDAYLDHLVSLPPDQHGTMQPMQPMQEGMQPIDGGMQPMQPMQEGM